MACSMLYIYDGGTEGNRACALSDIESYVKTV